MYNPDMNTLNYYHYYFQLNLKKYTDHDVSKHSHVLKFPIHKRKQGYLVPLIILLKTL